MKITYYGLICVICLFFACQRKEQKSEQKQENAETQTEEVVGDPVEAVQKRIDDIEKKLTSAHVKVVDYQSSKDLVEGKLSAYEKDGALLKLIDENNSKIGLIRIDYFFDKKGDLLCVSMHRQTHSNDKDEMVYVKEELMYLHKNEVVRIAEKVKTFTGKDKIDLSGTPEVVLEIKATEANAKAKRHKREADLMLFFLNSGKTYDEFFN